MILAVPTPTPARDATGRFVVYCDGIGFFLAKVDGAPAPGKLPLFLYTGFPGIVYVPKENWRDVVVYRNGCAADGKCAVFARGKVWLNEGATPDSKNLSGKYVIERNGQHLSGQFAAKLRYYKHPPRLCM